MKIYGEIAGLANLEAKLTDMRKRSKKSMLENIKLSVIEIHSNAKRSIAQVSKGEVVTRYSPKRTHTVSRPGDPPNSDTGRALSSIAFEINEQQIEGVVGSNLNYLKWLEYGTLHVAARPWLSVAFDKFRMKFKKIFNVKISEL
jgi:hypothetical protein